ncbi:MAG TPA: glycyl-radical enzyme activating protein [Syntrophus sp. (in: bacteria)]|nr:glycyl-radical enzyme activating protein [Syntrophus sp. (in: bacteria)]
MMSDTVWRMDSGVVFNIQRFSIHDGPGIRTTVFLKGCPLRCFWCQNPESQSGRPEIVFDRRKCTLCGACYAACPHGAIALEAGRPVFDRRICKGCGQCAVVCPSEARRLSGTRMTVEEVIREVLKDAKFYENSGGGVTLSGGEPLAQPEFARLLFKGCKQAELHTTLDTCGWAPWPDIEKLLEVVDLVLFDIKHLDASMHREAAGHDNLLILENARKISKLKPMRIRVPLVPGFNDSPEAVSAIAAFVKSELGSRDIDLLAYNRMGEVKYDFLEKSCVPLPSQSEDHLRMLESILGGQSAVPE